jgi:hypothetical protein
MTIAEFLAIIGGMLVQVGLVYAGNLALERKGHEEPRRLVAAIPLDFRQQVLLLGGIALLSSLVFDALEFGSTHFGLVDAASNYIIAVILAYVLFAAVAGSRMLPRVNEQQMLAIHLVVGLHLWFTQSEALPGWAWVLALIPTAALIFQGLWPRELPVIVRAFYYLWYLLTLLVLAFQNGADGLFASYVEISLPELFILGSIVTLLFLHVLVAARFFLIISSLIIPRNRPLLKLIMPRLMHAEQMSPAMLLIILLIAGIVLGIGYVGEVSFDQALVNLFVLGLLQVPGWLNDNDEAGGQELQPGAAEA